MIHHPLGAPPIICPPPTPAILLCILVLLIGAHSTARAATAAQPATGRTLQLVTDTACQTQISALMDQWEADRREEGWKVLAHPQPGGRGGA